MPVTHKGGRLQGVYSGGIHLRFLAVLDVDLEVLLSVVTQDSQWKYKGSKQPTKPSTQNVFCLQDV